jgi:transcriptional regulator with XRE-family HTH domain
MAAQEIPRSTAVYLGGQLRRVRDAQEITRYRLSKLTGISQSTLRDLERGDTVPTLATLLALVRGLRLASVEELFGGDRLGTVRLLELTYEDSVPIDSTATTVEQTTTA